MTSANDSSIEMTSELGTKCYRAPELFCNPPFCGPYMDFWSLGVIVHELLTGKKPFKSDIDMLKKVKENDLKFTLIKNEDARDFV